MQQVWIRARHAWARHQGWTIGTRLSLGFGLVLVLLLLVGGLAWVQFIRQDERLTRLADVDVQREALANQMELAVKDVVLSLANLCLLEDPQDKAEQRRQFQAATTRYNTARSALDQSLGQAAAPRLRQALDEVMAAEDGAVPIFSKMAAFDDSLERAIQADFYYTQVSGPQRIWQDRLGQLQAEMTSAMRAAVDTAQAQSAQVRTAMVALLTAALAIGLAASYLIRRSITAPLSAAVAFARTVAQGNLSSQVHAHRHDEIGALLQALQEMQMSLRTLVGDIHTCADHIQSASTEVASGNNDLSQRTEVTASNLQQTSSSLMHLTGTVKHSAEAAETANRLAASASSSARHGGTVVQQVVASMTDIAAASSKIAEITSVIDGIAFQTNLLALNAAVEAAQAGDQGRGFAVVAGEVRDLAQRAATAAQEIKGLIVDSADRVASGTRLVHEAGSAMQEIVEAVHRVTDVIAKITTTTTEQREGIHQVNAAMSQLDQMTQQNAALVEQSAAASVSLREQAVRLNGLVSTFQLNPT